MKGKIFAGVLILFLVLISFLIFSGEGKKEVAIQGRTIEVEISDTWEKRERGLMFREELCERCGMFFIFDEEKRHGFWMKNTKIPLDIVFIDRHNKVVDIHNAIPCNSSCHCKTYWPKEKAKYVLEVNGGMFNESVVGEEIKIIQ